MRDKIAKRAVDALRAEAKAAGKTCYLWDTELTGFGALCTKAGAASYFIEYRLGGRGTPSKRVTVGKHGALTPDEARKLAKEKLGQVANGIDVAERRKDERAKLAGLTFEEAVTKFLSVHAKPTRYWHEKKARLQSPDVKALAKKPLATIKRKHVADAIDKAKARANGAARLLFADLRPFFKWAHEREHIDKNPMDGLGAPPPAKSRDRVLLPDEIVAFWTAACELEWPFASIYILLLLTGARREEVAAMRWAELDLDNAVWRLPSAEEFKIKRFTKKGVERHDNRTKNTRQHRIHLVQQAIELLDPIAIAATKQKLGYQECEFIFSTTGKTPPSGFSKVKKRIDARMKELLGPKFKPWRTHDLRRTCATGMEDLGFDTRVVESGLNHVSGTKSGIVGVYQRADHREKVKLAFEAWGAHVASLVEGPQPSNVVPLKRAAG